jgi:hypothetical protein
MPLLNRSRFSLPFFTPLTALNNERLRADVDFGNQHLDLVGNNRAAFPLGLCEGDCDSDADCEGHLVCFQRGGNMAPVPGCLGTGVRSKDYCEFARRNNHQPIE